jgi:NhaP-type Na+/H+ or K+/H+ antiporter
MTHTGTGGVALGQSIAAQFSVALVMGAVGGWIWKTIAEQTGPITRLGYISTLGACLVLYFLTEAAGGSPVLSVFSFGLVIGNHESIHRHVHRGRRNMFGATLENIKRVQGSFTFFMRSFFFFALGTLFSFQMLQAGVLLICGGIVALVLLSRGVAVYLLSTAEPDLSPYRQLMTMMIPRGFVATVVSFLPAQRGIDIPQLPEIVLLTVIATTLVAMAGAYVFSRRKTGQERGASKSRRA